MENQLIPVQTSGSEMDAISEAKFETLAEAIVFYELAKRRLADVSNWAKICGTDSTIFELLDSKGVIPGELVEGNLIKIDIPGPGTRAGDGYDWVRIDEVAEGNNVNEQYFGFRVKPCANPEKPLEGTAHFFKDTASSTFLIRLSGTSVFAEMHGRNEEVNTVDPDFFDGLRNMAVGYSAKIGLSFPQWKLLVDGLVSKEQALTN